MWAFGWTPPRPILPTQTPTGGEDDEDDGEDEDDDGVDDVEDDDFDDVNDVEDDDPDGVDDVEDDNNDGVNYDDEEEDTLDISPLRSLSISLKTITFVLNVKRHAYCSYDGNGDVNIDDDDVCDDEIKCQ